jgi:hypothetical protein
LYDTLGPEAIVFIVNQSQLTTVFTSKLETPSVGLHSRVFGKAAGDGVVFRRAQLLKVKESCPSLRNVVQFEDVTEADVKAAATVGISLRSYADLLVHVRMSFSPV